jgi:membrane-associated phospholipid phosphatase
MAHLHFNVWIMEFLADHRSPALTTFFLAASDLGEVQGYLLISTLIYVMFDKRLAVRLSVLVSLTMSLNHVLKIIIKNPRPFIQEGDYLRKWAVPLSNARDLAIEYSTPAGHAMAGASYYPFLYGSVRNRYVRIAAVLAILLTGASRPYLGVHYVEDILLGWAIGLCVGLIALRHADRIATTWARFSYGQQIVIGVVGSLALWLATIAINGWRIDDQPRAFLGYAGIFTGIIIARPLELNIVDFDPTSSSILCKILRYLLSVGVAFLTLELLGKAFSMLADNFSLAGYGLQYVRYIVVGIVNIFVAPWVFTRIGLARTMQAAPEAASVPPV